MLKKIGDYMVKSTTKLIPFTRKPVFSPFIEYNVFTIEKPGASNDNHFRWERKHTTHNLDKALARATILSRKHNFERVEVQKVIHDHLFEQCQVKERFVVFESKADKALRILTSPWAIGIYAIAFGALCFTLFTY